MKKPRVVVADDNRQIWSFVATILDQQCTIVAEVADGEQAIETTLRLQPDVLILDISMPLVNGMEVARRLAELGSTARIVFLTGLEEWEYIEAALELGAYGYVVKKALGKDLPIAISAAVEGKAFYPKKPVHTVSAGWLEIDQAASVLDPSRRNEPQGFSRRSIFSAGDTAPFSGIYHVIHDHCDLERHYVVAIYGDVFPSCLKCASAVRFELRLSAVHVNAHPLFRRG